MLFQLHCYVIKNSIWILNVVIATVKEMIQGNDI